MNKFDKSLLDNIPGLSCIENYLIFVLKQENYTYNFLFYKSFLSLYKIIKEFVNSNVSYASFYLIERLQKTAKESEVINSEYMNSVEIPILKKNNHLAISVSPSYINDKYNTTLWRDDHFILLKQDDNENYYYLNDVPRDTGIINIEMIKKIYTGNYFLFTLNNIDKYTEQENHIIFMCLCQ